MKLISACKHAVKLVLGRERLTFEKIEKNKDISIVQKKNAFYSDLDESQLVTQNKNQYKQLVAIDGVGFSGSSALGDFLGEFSNCTSLGGVDPRENPDRGIENSYEVDFLRDPGSLLDLERICYTNVCRLRNNAVQQFLNVCKEYRDGCIPIFDDYFYNLSKKFLKDITAYAYNITDDYVYYFPKRLNVQEYRKIAKEYLISILKNFPSKDYLVCDNLSAVGRPDNGIIKDYLGDCKVLLNYSDPRDVYARARLEPGNEWVPIDPEIFVQNWIQDFIPEINEKDKNTLVTNFDDFCNDYDVQAKRIMDFLGLEEKDHVDKFKYFNPNVSINNTGVWRKLENQKPIEYIFENLKEFCYNKENHKRYV